MFGARVLTAGLPATASYPSLTFRPPAWPEVAPDARTAPQGRGRQSGGLPPCALDQSPAAAGPAGPGRRHSSAHACGARAALPNLALQLAVRRAATRTPACSGAACERSTSRPEGAAPVLVPDRVCPWGDASAARVRTLFGSMASCLTCHGPPGISGGTKYQLASAKRLQGRSGPKFGADRRGRGTNPGDSG